MRLTLWTRGFVMAACILASAIVCAQTSVYDKLKKQHIALPAFATPVASYTMYTRVDKMLYLSGHIPRKNGHPWTGQLGKNMQTPEGQQAARQSALELIATLHAATGGDLNRIKRIVKVVVMVNATDRFTEHHLVANGASTILTDIFGDKGKHARSAFGVAQLPLGACVEIEMIAELE